MTTQRKIFWAFAWLALLLVGAHLVARHVVIVVLRFEVAPPKPRSAEPRANTHELLLPLERPTRGSVPVDHTGATTTARESNTALEALHAAEPRTISARA